MMKRYTDNFAATHASICQRILSSPLAQSLTPSSRSFLENPDSPGMFSFVSAEFRGAGTSGTLYVEPNRSSDGLVKDSDGNEFQTFTITCKVNYPCHGSESSAVVLVRAAFLQQVATLGASIEAEFGQTPVYRLYRTAEQIADAKRKNEQHTMELKVRALVDANRKGMRVGQERHAPGDMSQLGIASGVYSVVAGEANGAHKKFTVNVGLRGANIRRVA